MYMPGDVRYGGYFDHYGNWFPNMEAMCRCWHISPATYRSRMMHGWSQQMALETPIRNHNRRRNYRYAYGPYGRRRKIR